MSTITAHPRFAILSITLVAFFALGVVATGHTHDAFANLSISQHNHAG